MQYMPRLTMSLRLQPPFSLLSFMQHPVADGGDRNAHGDSLGSGSNGVMETSTATYHCARTCPPLHGFPRHFTRLSFRVPREAGAWVIAG